MTIKTKVSFREYSKLLFSLTYKKPMMIILLSVAFIMLVCIAGYYLHFLRLPKPAFYQYIPLALITIVQPLVVYDTIWRIYYSSNHLREPLEIEMKKNEIKIKGESFYTEISWEKMYKFVEQKNWFLVYQNNLSAIIIPKKDFHGDDVAHLKKILRAIPNVPLHLKKE